MNLTLKHVIPLADDRSVTVTVEYDVTYHYDSGGWTSYGGDPPSHELDINESKVIDAQTTVIVEGTGEESITETPIDVARELYDVWADKHSEEIEGELFDAASEWEPSDD